MPVLPFVDLLILLGWTSLLVAFAQKAVYLATHYRPTIFGMTPIDFVLAAGILLIFALALAARTWVKLNEPRVLAAQRFAEAEAAHRHALRTDAEREEKAPAEPAAVGAGAARR